MGILSIVTDQAGQVGFNPRVIKIITTDNLATITTAGYLNPLSVEGYYILPTDEIHVWYGYVSASSPGTFAIFTPTMSNGVITLTQWASPGSVAIPTVTGDFAVFSNTSGALHDTGFLPSNAAKTTVVMLDAAPTINHVAKFTAANGTIGDGGVLGTAAAKAASDNAKATLASITAATTSGHLAQFNDTSGTIGDAGVATSAVQLSANIKAGTSPNLTGSMAGPYTITVAGLTAASVVVATVEASATAGIYVISATAGTGNFDVLLSADPGATCTVNYVAFIAAQ